jgi:hypothetical protein
MWFVVVVATGWVGKTKEKDRRIEGRRVQSIKRQEGGRGREENLLKLGVQSAVKTVLHDGWWW